MSDSKNIVYLCNRTVFGYTHQELYVNQTAEIFIELSGNIWFVKLFAIHCIFIVLNILYKAFAILYRFPCIIWSYWKWYCQHCTHFKSYFWNLYWNETRVLLKGNIFIIFILKWTFTQHRCFRKLYKGIYLLHWKTLRVIRLMLPRSWNVR